MGELQEPTGYSHLATNGLDRSMAKYRILTFSYLMLTLPKAVALKTQQ
jgi:hypothetical protein